MAPRIEGLLESDFPVSESWMRGDRQARHVWRPNLETLDDRFRQTCSKLSSRLGLDELASRSRRAFVARAAISKRQIIPWLQREREPHHREQPVELMLMSQAVGDATLIRCKSPIGLLDLDSDDAVDELYELQRRLGMVRVCTHFDAKHRRYIASVETDRLFHIDTTQYEEIEDIVRRTLLAADAIEEEMLNEDQDSSELLVESPEEGRDAKVG